MSEVQRINEISVRPLPDDLAKVARIELNEDPKLLTDSLRHLKEWIRKQQHLNARTDDQWLVSFLRGTKFRLERCKQKIDLYYSLRSTAPDLFCLKHSDPEVMNILDEGVGLVLPKLSSPTAPRVILVRPGCSDPNNLSIMGITAVAAMQQQICYLEDDNLNVSGSIHIMDLQGTKLSHYTQLTPLHMKKIVALNQDAAPTRVKSVHFINTPPFFETFFNIAKSFLNEKNRRRIHVYGKNYEALYEHVPLHIMPIEYGGKEYFVKDIADYWKKKFQQYHDWFEEDLKFGTVESKRLGKPKTAAMMSGVEGSFRQLDLD
ncbi:alpha-tocopherol transfer protein-like [Epargyreus clarus]|uniref:alpha-tocopherol transfer protein-like n=1 Tax=Epargyreus clarus TaxID=520877 RepID=UPI003C2FA09F